MTPFQILFVVFLLVPLLEIYLLIKVGAVIGALPTVFMVVFTAVLGAWLLRIQGFATLRRVQETLAQGGIPAMEMLEGAVLLIAGALLLTPGFFTDALGFLCLIPSLRRALIRRLLKDVLMSGMRGPGGPGGGAGPRVIEGEFRRDDER